MYQQILAELPPSLSTEITFFLYGQLLVQLPMFRCLGHEVLSRLAKSVTSVNLNRGVIVFHEGTFGEDMYFVISGMLEALAGGERLGYLGEGAFFGETTPVNVVPRHRAHRTPGVLLSMIASATSELALTTFSS